MKLIARVLVAVIVGARATASRVEVGSPVEKVVHLIEELKKNLEKDQKVEQQIYDKFACWCETATGKKAAAIHLAHEKIGELSKQILELKGTVAVLAQEIAELSGAIADNEEEQAKATSIRQQENAAFMKESGDLSRAINSLQQAIIVLSGAGTKTGLLQVSAALTTSARQRSTALIKSAMQELPSWATVSPKHLSMLETFTRSSEPEAADASASYAPQSATIQGILKDMYDTFATDLETQSMDEATKQRDFEDLIATKVKEAKFMKSEVNRKDTEKAEAEQQLADAVQELDDTTSTMKADIAFFDVTKEACKAKWEEWTERSKMRVEEIEGIDKALEILTSDEARELFARSIKPGMETFLQLDSSSDESASAMKAYDVLKEHARKSHSLRLAALAATVRSTGHGHFDAVIKEIDEMINVLKEEEADDIKQRDWCKKTYFENSEEKAELKWLIKRNEATIVKLQKTIDTLTENIEDTEKEIESTKAQMRKMTAERTDENEAFKQAKQDDQAAIELLGAAIGALSSYYEKNKIGMGPIEGSSKGFLQQPEFKVSQWQAPDASFKDKGARKGESKGIVSILTMLKEDLEDEIKNGVKDEATSQVEYEKAMKEAKTLVKTLEEKKINLETDRTKTEEKKEVEEGKLADNHESLVINEEYKHSIKPDCDWMMNSFEERRQKRKAEMEGLTTAKEYLSGATPPAMLQTSSGFDDESFGRISFKGVHQ